MKTHPFDPLIPKTCKKLLIGTLPPEDVPFYFSNSSNTRLWDILKAIDEKKQFIGQGGNKLNSVTKTAILARLNLGVSDIIYKYERDDYHSTKDKHIIPIEYKNLRELAFDNNIDELLFVYQSAYKWFLHSLSGEKPVRLRKLKGKYIIGKQSEIRYRGKSIKCTLLPSPLNRGSKGQTLKFKLDFYETHIRPSK